ncbi:MAG: zinc-binding dehydrogenase [Treponema sp.]|nr:zinc-binding dehydrogenase [Treponema sp.]
MTSRNIKIINKGQVVCVSEELDNSPLKEGEILVRNEASLISTGTELSRVYGLKKGVVYPVYPGYASIGKIENTGTGVNFAKGDRVLYSGPHQEFFRFPVETMSSLGMVVKLGNEFNELNSIDASLIHLGLVAMNGILPAELKLGDTVCVFGLGIVGLLTALLYQASGVQVLGVDTVENRAAHAKNACLQNVLAAPAEEQIEAVTGFFGRETVYSAERTKVSEGSPPDITVDATGRSEGIVNAIMCCGKNGQVLLLGSPREDYTCNVTGVFNHLHMNMITLIGAFNGRYPFSKKEGSRESIERNFASFASLIKKGTIEPKRIISHVVKPEAAMEAYDGLYNHRDTYYCAAFDWS